MDVSKMTLRALEAAYEKVVESEDAFGRPDVHTEDLIAAEIARRKATTGPIVKFYPSTPY